MPCIDDNNVCAYAIIALILLPVVNFLPEMDSETAISRMMRIFWPPDAFSRLIRRSYPLYTCSFDHISTSDSKSDVIGEFSAAGFL